MYGMEQWCLYTHSAPTHSLVRTVRSGRTRNIYQKNKKVPKKMKALKVSPSKGSAGNFWSGYQIYEITPPRLLLRCKSMWDMKGSSVRWQRGRGEGKGPPRGVLSPNLRGMWSSRHLNPTCLHCLVCWQSELVRSAKIVHWCCMGIRFDYPHNVGIAKIA